jgi:dynein heavy chain 1, cytosolic
MFIFSSFLKGDIKGTNRSREMLNRVSKGQVPKHWSTEYSVFKNLNLTNWINDLNDRIKSWDKYRSIVLNISNSKSVSVMSFSSPYWLGGFFGPEALITATRQAAAEVLFLHT